MTSAEVALSLFAGRSCYGPVLTGTITHQARLWLWTSTKAPASWHFLTIDGDAGVAIAAHEAMQRLEMGKARGFGSVKVLARIGESCWNSSVFPGSARGGFLLPVKAAIRRAEDLAEGDDVVVRLQLL